MTNRWSDIAYPWGPALESFVELKSDVDVLKTSIINILLTRRGERVMLPEFGSAVPDALFEPNDSSLVAIIRASVQEAIQKWDDRVVFHACTAEITDNVLHIKVEFKSAKDPASFHELQVLEFSVTPSVIGK